MRFSSSVAAITKKVFAAVIEITDSKAKDGKVIDYGQKNAFPNELLKIVDASPTAVACIDKKSSFITADGFTDRSFAFKKNVKGQTMDQVLNDAADSEAIFEGRAYRILYNLEGMPASMEVLPFETVRKVKGGGFVVNPNFGTREYKETENVFYEEFNPKITGDKRLQIIAENGGFANQKGEILYSYRNRPGKNIYPVPMYYSGIEDVRSDTGIMLLENSNIEQGFNVDFILYTVGDIDDEIKGSDGLTDLERFRHSLKKFREPGDKKILHIQSETKDGMPVFTPVPLQQILDGVDKARDRVPRAVCRHIGVPPVIIGMNAPEGFGNTQALANYIKLFNHSILKAQNEISMDFKKVFPDADTSISTLNIVDYIPAEILSKLTDDEIRAIAGYKPLPKTDVSGGVSLAQTLGVAGTQALQGILIDVNLTQQQKVEILQVLFNITRENALKMVYGQSNIETNAN